MKTGRVAILALMALTSAVTAQECVPRSGACSNGESCCGGLECIRKNDYYAQCRLPGDVPDGWGAGPEATSGDAGAAGGGALPAAEDTESVATGGAPPPPSVPLPASPNAAATCAATFHQCGAGCGTPGCAGRCCDPDDHCVRKDQEYAQCRPRAYAIRDEWDGTILEPAVLPEVPVATTAEAVPEEMEVVVPEEEVVVPEEEVVVPEEEVVVPEEEVVVPEEEVVVPEEEVVVPEERVLPEEVPEEEVPEEVATSAVAEPELLAADVNGQCAATNQACGGGCGAAGCSGVCCSTEDHCMKKNEYYAQCRRKGDGVPEGWLGTVIQPSADAAAVTVTPRTAPVVAPRVPTAEAAPVQATCVATYKKCGAGCGFPGCGGNCCDPEDHCVRKAGFFAQCRPKSSEIPSTWDGTILTPDFVV